MATVRSVHAIYENGTLRLLEPVELKEGEEVVVQIPIVESVPKKKRIFDMHSGNYWMSDDFDDELPDSFWFGMMKSEYSFGHS
jgi:predicted DNA-binding antitoxin AbrB/MazE fold protein